MAQSSDVRVLAESLGAIILGNPSDEQRSNFQLYLDAAKRGRCVGNVIDFPLQRYNGRTLLHLAADNGLWEYLEELLKNGGDPNKASSLPDLCQTPLHLAARKGYARCLQILLKYGAQIRTENSQRVTPFDLARGKPNCEKIFQQAIVKVEIPHRTMEQQQRVRDLHDILVNNPGNSNPKEFYELYRDLREVERDLGTRWTDWFQQTLLFRAVFQGFEEIVEFLLQQSANQPLANLGNSETPLLAACRKGSAKMASLLIDHSPHLLFVADDTNQLTPLHISSSRGDHTIVKIILAKMEDLEGAVEDLEIDLNSQDKLGRTPLFNACFHGRLEVVQLLLEFGKRFPALMNLNLAETHGRTPLHAAVATAKNSVPIVRCLLERRGLDINVEGKPSSRAQKHLRRMVERKRSLTVASPSVRVSSPEGIGNGQAFSFRGGGESPFSTASVETLSTLGSCVSDDIDAKMGILEGHFSPPLLSNPPGEITAESFTMVPSSHRVTESLVGIGLRVGAPTTMPSPRMGRMFTLAFPSQSTAESAFGVYRSPTGRLEVLDQKPASHKALAEIGITPLAEACVFNSTEVIDMLISAGARDPQGLACQIGFLLGRHSIPQKILLRECSRIQTLDTALSGDPESTYSLTWSRKNLTEIRSDWLSERARFHAPGSGGRGDAGDDSDDDGGTPSRVPTRKISYANIRYVYLSHNHLETIPFELFSLPCVHRIDLSHNKLTFLPDEGEAGSTWNCIGLEDLNLSSNCLIELPTCLWKLYSLRRLFAERNKLERLVSDAGCHFCWELVAPSLQEVILARNELASIPEFLFSLPQLQKVDLSQNRLKTVPESLWENQSLQELNLSHNQLQFLPHCVTDELTCLDYTSSPVEETILTLAQPVLLTTANIPADMSRQRSIKRGSGWGRSTRTTSSGAGGDDFRIRQLDEGGLEQQESTELVEVCDYSALYKLNLSSNKLAFFPTGLPCLAPNLLELDISSNPIRSIDVRFLPQSVKTLVARHCEIQRFGTTLTRRQATRVAQRCYHDDGAPACVHRCHAHLPNLHYLRLNGNKLKRLQLMIHQPLTYPEQDPTMAELEFIPSVATLDLLYPELEGLHLPNNLLEGTFNPNIGHQFQLQSIQLQGNPNLQRLPLQLALLKNNRLITEINISQLPKLVEPPAEYHNVQPVQLLTYLRSLLKKSVPYRTMKLFFIGKGQRGKTTLLRRLKEVSAEKTDRTVGIEIEDWECRGEKKMFSKFRLRREPIKFIAWDFAGQDVYHVTHQCFYSKRSLYLALFRLSDGKKGVTELEPWLRNVQLRAPGCVVIIVGTHLDELSSDSDAYPIEQEARSHFADHSIYPQVVGCISVSSTRRIGPNNIDRLRQLIYNVACHLQVSPKDGSTLEYKADMEENSVHALLQQQIPKSFLDLQEKISDVIHTYKKISKPPIMDGAEFRAEFKNYFDDDDEMNEAVHYLNLQGTLLHFEDYVLRDMYFLDPQWLAKLMAQIISPNAEVVTQFTSTNPCRGKVLISRLLQNEFSQLHPKTLATYLQLLQKFEVAMKISKEEVIIPSLMADEGRYPQPNDSLKDVDMSEGMEDAYQPTIRRFWLSNYIPAGFWPRLICRIIMDQQVKEVLDKYIDNAHSVASTLFSDGFDWRLWKTGIAFISRGRTLVLIHQVANLRGGWEGRILPGNHRLEVHIYAGEMVRVIDELREQDRSQFPGFESSDDSYLSPYAIIGHATKLMVDVCNHIVALSSWFQGMFLDPQKQLPNVGYIPCWKCYGEISPPSPLKKSSLSRLGGGGAMVSSAEQFIYLSHISKPVFVLLFNDCIIPAAREKDLFCPLHGPLKTLHVAPDLVFWDLANDSLEDSPSYNTLRIHENELLGKGGFGFVCKAELVPENPGSMGQVARHKQVAVKVFLIDVENKMETSSTYELLNLSREDKQLLHAYKEIRQEVSFLSSLSHPNITSLCGVRTHPTMCLLLELAPKKALNKILKEYRELSLFLEPLTMKQCAKQIASGLDYLHGRQIVHLDMKSPNVLVWNFPVPTLPRAQRITNAGNVLLKIADYGISQISTSMVMRTGQNTGTPGYMAPELFDQQGQEIMADKVDVFAFGMTMYETVSLYAPFHRLQAQKRNHEVRNGKRPPLGNKEKRSPLLLQDMMQLSWDTNPSSRPTMAQCYKWANSPEFERLRTEITLGDVTSISCACVGRVDPDWEEEAPPPDPPNLEQTTAAAAESPESSLPSSIPRLGPLMNEEELKKYGILAPQKEDEDVQIEKRQEPNQLPSGTEDLDHESEDAGIDGGFILVSPSHSMDEVANSRGQSSKSLTPNGQPVSRSQSLESSQSSITVGDAEKRGAKFEPYTQVWMCGRDQKKGLLATFLFPDNRKIYKRFFGYVGKDEIQALCPIRNYLWMGTSQGKLRVIHAPSLKVKYSGKLFQGAQKGSAVLKILHIGKEACVFVSVHSGHVWCLRDHLVGGGLFVEQHLATDEQQGCGPVYDLVDARVGGVQQVWGTMDNNTLLLLEKHDGKWCPFYHKLNPFGTHMKYCSHIVYCNFTEESGTEQHLLWISYQNRGGLVCFDAQRKAQKHSFNCSDVLQSSNDVDCNYQVTSLLAQGRRLYVGTVTGLVAVFDSLTYGLLTHFLWHKGKVRSLLLLPEEIKACVCAEVPFKGSESKVTSAFERRSSHSSLGTLQDNPLFMANTGGQLAMVASIGNGRRRYSCASKAEKSASLTRTRTVGASVRDDVTLLLWNS